MLTNQILQRHARLDKARRSQLLPSASLNRHALGPKASSTVQVDFSLASKATHHKRSSREDIELPCIDTTTSIRVRWLDADMSINVFPDKKRMILSAQSRGFGYMGPKYVEKEASLPRTKGRELRLDVEEIVVWFLWQNNLTDWVPDKIWARSASPDVDGATASSIGESLRDQPYDL